MLSSIKEKLERFFPSGDLYERTVKSSLWMGGIRLFTRGFQLLRMIVVARFLAPHDFGLFGIAMLSMAVLEIFSQPGFEAKLIQEKENIESYLDTAWISLFIRGAAIFGVLWLASPYIAGFFENPAASPLIKAVGFVALLRGVKNVGIVYFRKELEFHKQFAYRFGMAFTSFSVTVILAILWGSVWALLIGSIAGSLVGFVLSFVLHPYRPGLSFDLDKAKHMFGYGKWLLGLSIVVFVCTQGDDIFLGKVLGATALGFYQMAYRISNTPATELTHVISGVTFPAYSKIQDDINRLKNGFVKVLRLTTLLSIPLGVGIFVLAPEFVSIFLGEKWIPIVLPLRILAISGVIRSIVASGGPIFKATENPKWDFEMNLFRLLTILGTIYFFTKAWGISGTSLSVLLGITATFPYWFNRLSKTIHLSIKNLIFPLIPSLVGSIVSGGAILCLKILLPSSSLYFICLVFAYLLTYFGGLHLLDNLERYENINEIKGIFAVLNN